MIFRNLTLFRFPTAVDLSSFDTELADAACKPVGPQETVSQGFVPPHGNDSGYYHHQVGDSYWLAVERQERNLPASVVNDKLADRVAHFEAQEGRKPGGKTRRRMRDDLVFDLLPQAFVTRRRLDVLINTKLGFVAVNTTSRKAAESVISEIRGVLGSFPALPLNAEVAPRAVLTGWLSGESLPDFLKLGDEAELRDPVTGGAVVRVQHQELVSDEVAKHLDAGKQCTRLALNVADHLSLVLGEDLVVRKLKFLDGATDSLMNQESEDLGEELDARFALAAGEIASLFIVLEAALKLSRAEVSHG